MPWFRASYCGVARYFSNSESQAAASKGGSAPVTGRHSVIERPEPVSRVMPPITIIATMRAKRMESHRAMPRRAVGAEAGAAAGGGAAAPFSPTSSKILRVLAMLPLRLRV